MCWTSCGLPSTLSTGGMQSHLLRCSMTTPNGEASATAICGGSRNPVDAVLTRPVRSCRSNAGSEAPARFRSSLSSRNSETRSSVLRCGRVLAMVTRSGSSSSRSVTAGSPTCRDAPHAARPNALRVVDRALVLSGLYCASSFAVSSIQSMASSGMQRPCVPS